MLVSEIMHSSVSTIHPEATLRQAAVLMLDRGVTGLPVLDSAYRLVGLIEMKDILRAPMPRGSSTFSARHIPEDDIAERLESLRVSNVMATNVHSVKEDDSIPSAVALVVNLGVELCLFSEVRSS